MGNASLTDLPEHYQRQVREKWDAEEQARKLYAPDKLPKRKAKYNNVRTKFKSVQGFEVWADSKLEAKFFALLDQGMVAGGIHWWIPHPKFPLPGGVVYEADALVVERGLGANVKVYDVKGMDTAISKAKRKQVKALFGIDVEIVRK